MNDQSTKPHSHLSDAELNAYIHQTVPKQMQQEWQQHLQDCDDCTQRLAEHNDFARRLDQTLKSQLAVVSPPASANWTAIAPQVRRARMWNRIGLGNRRVLAGAMAAVYLLLLVGGSFVLFTLIRNFTAEQQTVSLVEQPTAPARTPILSGAATATLDPKITPGTPHLPEQPPVWTGSERVNVLILGVDQRGQTGGPWRTDTMIILTVDPDSKTAGMISIPRDLWVPIWAYNIDNRINTAHYYGDARDYPGGGPALARDTVAYNLGIPIHHYARLNFTAFETLIDEIGGIDIDVTKAINDPQYPDGNYGYDPFYLAAGRQHLDGKTALKYARTRHGSSDFDRARRQQQVILAVRDQIVQLDQLPRLISQAPSMLQELGDAVRTDLTLDQAKMLAQLLGTIPAENIHGDVIDQNYTIPYVTETGAAVLIPIRAKIGELYESFVPQN